MPNQFRTLFLVRHAKSSWKDLTLADHDRPLNKRGKKNAPMMGQRLAGMPCLPEVIISSSAMRALTTAQTLAPFAEIDPEDVIVNPSLYGAGSRNIMRIICNLDDHFSSAMMVGHNPGITQMANELGGQPIANVPTCGIVVIRFDTDQWAEAGAAPSTLLEYDYPKKISEAIRTAWFASI